ITQHPQGLMAAETGSNNKYTFQPLHPCLVGLPWLPNRRAACRRNGDSAERINNAPNPLFRLVRSRTGRFLAEREAHHWPCRDGWLVAGT
ncbi:hypothetical protein, partial [Spirosoma panaciterrae]|uniref:hypothetical protein n=1 Tax=Spirosoma panaciterrae TaxID=496058 RepID=UPI00059455B4